MEWRKQDLLRRWEIYFERRQLQKRISPNDKYETIIEKFSPVLTWNWSRWGCKVMCCSISVWGEFGLGLLASISYLRVSTRPRHLWTAFKQNQPEMLLAMIRHTFFPSVSNTQFFPPSPFFSLSCRDEKTFPRVIDRGRQKMCTTSRQKAELSRKNDGALLW